jgi:hypothetical protein
MENKYYYESVFQNANTGRIEVICYDINSDKKVALIELKYQCDEEYEEWSIIGKEYYRKKSVAKQKELEDELLRDANDNFHEFCRECFYAEDDDDYEEFAWFI